MTNLSSTSEKSEVILPSGFGLGPRELDTVFPFHFVIDSETRVIRAGPAIQRLLPDLAGGEKLDSSFRIKHPANLVEYKEICEHSDQLFLLEARSSGKLLLKGQMLYLPHANVIVFIGAPWLTDSSGINALGLSLNDFAIHDSVPDYLLLLHTLTVSLGDARVLAEQLNVMNRQLEDRIEERTQEVVSANATLTETNRRLLQEITERKRAEKVLWESESKLQAILDNAPVGIWLVGVDKRYRFVNKTFCDAVGIAESRFLAATHLPDLLGAEIAANCMKSDRECLAKETPHISYEELPFVDGKQHLIEITKVKLRDGAGVVTGSIGISIDITERKQAELALQESENRFRMMSDSAPVLIWMSGTDKLCSYFNKSWLDFTGRTPEQEMGNGWTEGVYPEDFQHCLDTYVSAFDARQEFSIEYRLRRHDGEYRWVVDHGVPRHDSHGIFLGYIGSCVDITERKNFEEELKRSNAELEQFSYAVSHDMRQPLRMISSYLQLLEKSLSGQLDGEKCDYFNFAIDGAKRIDQMLVALLEYSRVGRTGEPPTWIESRAVLDEALQFIQPAITEAQARLTISGDWPRILASHDEILRLLQNLICNAAKFRVAGRIPEITVTSKIDKNEWHLSVADNGVGIIPEQIKRLFQVFQRLQSREAYEGTGIGLALCRKIVEHHKGRIWAESSGEGRGSKFCVVLPLRGGGGVDNALEGNSSPYEA